MNKKILISLSVIGAVAAIAIGGTIAYFSDTETSTGNTFTAGSLDLTVDNDCYYNKIADGTTNCPTVADNPQTPENEAIITTWESTNLGVAHKFFYFDDVKPGDFGEDTVSLTVDNDAWLRLVIKNVTDLDNSCTEPESLVDPDGSTCGTDGELRENLLFTVWADTGILNELGDSQECDNIYQPGLENVLIYEGTINAGGETWDLAQLGGAYLWAGIKACLGISWRLPSTVGNEVQSDSMIGTMEFQVQQHRNNPSPVWQ